MCARHKITATRFPTAAAAAALMVVVISSNTHAYKHTNIFHRNIYVLIYGLTRARL